MRFIRVLGLTALSLGVFATAAQAVPEGWHKSLKDGLEASAKSGKPLLLVSGWKDKI